MGYTRRLHHLIQRDYEEAYGWYEDQQKGLGERFIKAVRHTIEQITLHPETYGSRGNKNFREAKVEFFPYVVVFQLNKREKIVYISSIHHTKRHPRKKYRKR